MIPQPRAQRRSPWTPPERVSAQWSPRSGKENRNVHDCLHLWSPIRVWAFRLILEERGNDFHPPWRWRRSGPECCAGRSACTFWAHSWRCWQFLGSAPPMVSWKHTSSANVMDALTEMQIQSRNDWKGGGTSSSHQSETFHSQTYEARCLFQNSRNNVAVAC